MKVSVVIPVFNEEKYIENCLKKLFKQEIPPAEIIIVDNNCTDTTIQIAKRFDVKIINEPKQGMIAARNKGFEMAKYDIIARCDADTLVPVDWTKKIIYNFEHYDIDALTGPHYFFDFLSYFKKPMVLLTGLLAYKMGTLFIKHDVLYGANMALSTKVWKKVKNEVCLDELETQEDTDLALHIHKYGNIRFDWNLIVGISARRMKRDPITFLIRYPLRSYSNMNRCYTKRPMV